MAQVPLETGNGKLITIGQVATVAWGYPTPTGDALVDGGHGLMMVVEKFPGANTLQVTRGVEAALGGAGARPARRPRGHRASSGRPRSSRPRSATSACR